MKGISMMKRTTWVIGMMLLAVGLVGIFTIKLAPSAAADDSGKKAILVVSFGTTYLDTLHKTIESTENRFKAAFPGYEVRRAFTSRIIIKKLAERDGIAVDTEKQALDRLIKEGYQEVYIQPLHVSPGEEYDLVKALVTHYAHQKKFNGVVLGRPLLYYMGQEGMPDDYSIAIKALRNQMPKLKAHEAVVLMGHGGLHPGNATYAALQLKLEQAGLTNVFVYTVEGFPAFDQVIAKLQKQQIKKVTLMPLMMVAGDHANNDMAGDEEDSAKTQLIKADIKTDIYLHGLGENKAIQEIYIQHLKDAIQSQVNKHSSK